MALDIGFPLFILEPSNDFSETFMWKLYQACRTRDEHCELLSRYIFDAVRQPPLRLFYQKKGFDGSFGFYDCESSLHLFRASLDERKAGMPNETAPSYLYKVFVLSLWDIYYDLPYEYLDEMEDPTPTELEEERKRIKAYGRELQQRERGNLFRLMQEGEEYGIRMIISAAWTKRNLKMIKETQEKSKTVLIRERNASAFFNVYTGGKLIGQLTMKDAEALLAAKITG